MRFGIENEFGERDPTADPYNEGFIAETDGPREDAGRFTGASVPLPRTRPLEVEPSQPSPEPAPSLPATEPAPTVETPRVERPADSVPATDPSAGDMRTLSSTLADLFASINARPAGGYAAGAQKPTAIVAPGFEGESSGGIKPGWIILLLLAIGGGYWYYKKRKGKSHA